MRSRRLAPALAGALVVLVAAAEAMAAQAYVRYPDIHGDHIVFAAESDLWITSDRGGDCRRLTSHLGVEYFPRFSPDGRQVAFTGEYDGNFDVYVVSVEGGEPRRLTWHPYGDEVLGWTPDGRHVLFRSTRQQPNGEWEIYSVPVEGGEAEKLPLGWASRLAIDPVSGRYAFTRAEREFRTWKRYRGGTAPDIWAGDPARADYARISPTAAAGDTFPMWVGDRIYFLNDLGGTQNLWSMRADGADRQQHTHFDAWDVRWPASGPDGRVVFTLAADLHLYDPATEQERKLDVDVASEHLLTRTRYPDAARSITTFDLAPEGERLAIVTRGEIFSVPVKQGVTLPVTRGSGARESRASFSPDGKKLVYVSDATREEDIRVIDAWGRGEPAVVVPAASSGWHYPPVFSAGEKWIAWSDQTQTLWIAPAAGGTPRPVDRSVQTDITDYAWSPDGRWLAYSKTLPNGYAMLSIYDTRNGRAHAVTDPTTQDYAPVWDPKGRYLYFLSDRATNPLLGDRDWDNIEARNTKPYLLLLRKDVRNPFAPLAGLPDGEDGKKEGGEKGATGKDGSEKREKPEPVEIDLDGLSERVVEVPVDRGRYAALGATPGKLFYVAAPLKGLAELPDLFEEAPADDTLMVFDLEEKEAKPFLEKISGYALARDTDKVAVMKEPGEIYVLDTASPPAPEKLEKDKVALDGLVVELDPREEWAQIFYESWRRIRDFYWDPGLGGMDWKAERKRYASLLPRLASRDDLEDLVGELIGEMNTSHTYVFGGDPGVELPEVPTGLLGARFERQGPAFKVTRIYRADPAGGVRSPLGAPGAGVHEGDFILAMNHRAFEGPRPIEAYLADQSDKEIVLTVNSRPKVKGARDVAVRTLDADENHDLIYSDWVRRNREHVAEKTDGKIAYIHVPDMWKAGLIEFNTWFYPQLDREGMVVDVRWNGGGAVSQMLVERFKRRLLAFNRARGGGVWTYPRRVLNGPFVVLTNEFAGSDGDIFPRVIQLEKLAPVIGMRSWGGVVGIHLGKLLVDGGIVTAPQFAWWEPGLGWDLENRGVIPDIELQNLPQDLARGIDAQLDRAIEEVLRLRAEHPPVKPEFGPVRERTRDAYRERELGRPESVSP
jgi:tricorn protease